MADYADTYAGINIDHEESYRYLYLFEVRRDCRGRGIGKEAVDLLSSGFDYLTLLALPKAEVFGRRPSLSIMSELVRKIHESNSCLCAAQTKHRTFLP